jgi:phosphoribosylglycinamide formyltransferase-1
MTRRLEDLRFAIFASGRGSNALALLSAFERGYLPGKVALLVCNVEGAPVIEKARARGVDVAVIPHKGIKREEHEVKVQAALSAARVDDILLAGYMRVLTEHFLRTFGGTVINIHPSLLPDFPGLHGAERQWEAGMKVAGATVHLVDAGLDSGQVLLQGSLEVRGDEGPDGLADRILHEVEHVIYARAVRLFCDRLLRQWEGDSK